MKGRWLTVMLFPALLAAQTTRDSVLTATSNRVARLPADRASLMIGIDGTAETAKDAVARAETKAAAVVEALKRVPAGVQVGRPVTYTVTPTPAMRSFPAPPSGPSFTAKVAIRLVVTNLDQLAAALAAALDGGAASVSTAAYEFSKADSVRRTLSTEALAAARKDVEAIAAGLGGTLGTLVDAGSTSPFTNINPSMFFPADVYGTQQSSTPEVTISVNLTVRFRLTR